MENDKVVNTAFSRNDTKAIKGVAIILMLFHHIAGFGNARWPLDFAGFKSLWPAFAENGYLTDLALGAKICVSLFFFLGGYGLYVRWKKSSFNIASSIMSLYKGFWKVFAVFVPIAFVFFGKTGSAYNTLCTRYNITSVKDLATRLVSNFIGWSPYINFEWWVLSSYICALLLGYLFCVYNKKRNDFWVEFFIVLVVDILIRNIFPAIAKTQTFASLTTNVYYGRLLTINSFSSVFFAGIVFAKYNAVATIKASVKKQPFYPIIAMFFICVIFYARVYITRNTADIICTPLLVSLISVVFDLLKPIKTVFAFLGQHSTNMWLIHSFYCYYFYEFTKIVFSTQNVWIDLLILTVLSLASSIALNGFYSGIITLSKCIKRLRSKTSLSNSEV